MVILIMILIPDAYGNDKDDNHYHHCQNDDNNNNDNNENNDGNNKIVVIKLIIKILTIMVMMMRRREMINVVARTLRCSTALLMCVLRISGTVSCVIACRQSEEYKR